MPMSSCWPPITTRCRNGSPPELAAKDERFKYLDQLQSVPILGVHMEFDRPVLPDPHAALTTGPLQWLFRKDAARQKSSPASSAPARDYVGRPREDCLNEFEAADQKSLPEAADAKLLTGVIVIEKRATFAAAARHRPPPPHQAPPTDGIQISIWPATTPKPTGPPPWKAPPAAVTSPPTQCSRIENRPRPFFWSRFAEPMARDGLLGLGR